MDRLTSNLLLYRDLGEDSILLRLAEVFRITAPEAPRTKLWLAASMRR